MDRPRGITGKSSRRARRAKPAGIAVACPLPLPRPTPAVWTLIIVLAATPLCLANGVFLSHDVIPKVIAVLTGAALLLLLLPQWSAGIGILRRSRAGSIFLILAAAQLVSLILSTASSGQPGLALAGTLWRRFGAVEQIAILVIAVAAAAAAAIDRRWPVLLFRAIGVSGALASLYAILQHFGVDPFLDEALYKLDYLGGIVRPPATMGHAIYLAAWLAPVALIAAASAWSESGAAWKWLQGVAAALACVAIFLSGTRGALLAVLFAAIYFLIRTGGDAARKLRLQFAAAAGIVTVLICGVTLSPAGASIRNRLRQWREDLGGPRLAVWRESPAILVKYPLLGAGPDTFAGEFRKIESETLSRAYPDFYHETPHNALIDAACAQGIPGALILAALFAFGITAGRWRRSAQSPIIPGLEAAVFAISIGSLFASFTIVESMVLWSIAGIAAALTIEDERTLSIRPATGWLIPAALPAGAFLLFAIVLSVPDAVYAGLSEAVQQRDPATAVRIYSTASEWGLGLPLPGYELFASREFATLGRSLAGRPDAAKAWAESADAAAVAETRSEERFSAAYQSSVLAIAAGDLGRAEKEARIAIELAPNWYRPHLFLAKILAATGRIPESAAEEKNSARLGAKVP